MNLQCNREKLLQAFLTAASVAPPRSPKPILQNVKLEVTSEGVTLMGTDLEVGIRVNVSGQEVQAPGSAVLPVMRFRSILQESSDESLMLSSDGRQIQVRGQRSEFQLPAVNPDEFPNVVSFEAEQYHELPTRFFRELIRRTVLATETESTRYALGGVLVEFAEGSITAVGTDGRRLARQCGPAQAVGGQGGEQGATIIPARAMHLMERAFAGDEENVQLAVRENEVLVRSRQATVIARLLEGRFPRWRDVFPRHEDTVKIDLSVGPFFAAVRQAAIVTSAERRGIDCRFGEGKVVLSGHGAEAGESRVELPIAYDGKDICITLDPRYLSDFFRVLDPDMTFTVTLKDSETAAVLATEDGYAYVVMPLAQDRQGASQ